MLYQFPFETALFTSLFDLALIGLTFGASRIAKTTYRRTSFIIIFLLFSGCSLIKIMGSSPAMVASSPNDLTFSSHSSIGTFYLARAKKDSYFIFWKQTILSKQGTLTVEMEGIYPDQLRILKKIDGQYRELQPDLTIEGKHYETIDINLPDLEFGILSEEGKQALENVWKRDLVNYLSNLLSILFLVSFIWFTLKSLQA